MFLVGLAFVLQLHILSLYSFLTSVEGGLKNDSAARQEAVDISQFLKMINPGQPM